MGGGVQGGLGRFREVLGGEGGRISRGREGGFQVGGGDQGRWLQRRREAPGGFLGVCWGFQGRWEVRGEEGSVTGGFQGRGSGGLRGVSGEVQGGGFREVSGGLREVGGQGEDGGVGGREGFQGEEREEGEVRSFLGVWGFRVFWL